MFLPLVLDIVELGQRKGAKGRRLCGNGTDSEIQWQQRVAQDNLLEDNAMRYLTLGVGCEGDQEGNNEDYIKAVERNDAKAC